jgi:large subunit ribosomal protein L3
LHGQVGYHLRTEYNKQIAKIGKDPKEVEPKGGFLRYGQIKNPYVLVKGSIAGTAKRMIKITHAARPDMVLPKEAPPVLYISTESKQ